MTIDRTANLIGALAFALADDVAAAIGDLVPDNVPPSAVALIGHAPWITVVELAGALRLSHSATVRLVDRMEAAGLVRRGKSDRDGRAVLLSLTDTGEEAAARISDARLASVQSLLKGLAPREQAAFGMIAEKALAALIRDGDHAVRICRLCTPKVCTDCPVEPMLPQR